MRKLKTLKEASRFRNRGPVTFGHMHYLSLLQAGVVSAEYNNRAFKFAFARNPYARIASLYNYLAPRDLSDQQCFDRFLDNVRLCPPIGLYNKSGLSQANPQVDWLLDLSGNLLVDRIFKVEEIDEFPHFLNATYNLKTGPLAQRNTSTTLVGIEDITGNSERREKVNEIYARDFDFLGYDMISSRP